MGASGSGSGSGSGPDADDLVRLFVCSTAIDRLVPLSSGGDTSLLSYMDAVHLYLGFKEGVAASEDDAQVVCVAADFDFMGVETKAQ
ncbi:MAG: hypothetical protein ACLGID_05285 [Gammaproteobacteria bacterium]